MNVFYHRSRSILLASKFDAGLRLSQFQPVLMEYLPFRHVIIALERKYSPDDRCAMPIRYKDDLLRSMKAVCKMIQLDLETLAIKNTYARQVGRCLYTELDLLPEVSDILTVMEAFTKRYMLTEPAREEVRQLIQGSLVCDIDSLSDDDDEDCLSDCGTDCFESSEASERSGYHRLRMTIRELLGARRTQVVYEKKHGKKRRLRRIFTPVDTPTAAH